MIGFLRGRVIDKQPQRIVVDVQGVGYELSVPLSTYYEVGDEGSEVALRVHTHVREDALQLFGFLTALEQELFQKLIAVSGIGPKLALAVLSGIEARELVGAIQRADVARLTRTPGVGKKTAERIVLELKDRLAHLAALPAAGAAPASPADRLQDDVISALLNLGYQRNAAEKAAAVVKGRGDLSFESALKDALRELMR